MFQATDHGGERENSPDSIAPRFDLEGVDFEYAADSLDLFVVKLVCHVAHLTQEIDRVDLNHLPNIRVASTFIVILQWNHPLQSIK